VIRGHGNVIRQIGTTQRNSRQTSSLPSRFPTASQLADVERATQSSVLGEADGPRERRAGFANEFFLLESMIHSPLLGFNTRAP